jgi:hypothetical protein
MGEHMKMAMTLLLLFYALLYFKFFDVRYVVLCAVLVFVKWSWKDSNRWSRAALLGAVTLSLITTFYWLPGRAWWLTIPLLVSSVFLAGRLVQRGMRHRALNWQRRFVLYAGTSALLFWVTASTYDYFAPSQHALPLDHARLEARRNNWPATRVAIALSGGG